jgi:hypothetical protein
MEVNTKKDYFIIGIEYCKHLWNEVKFYTQYTPKFIRFLMYHRKSLWRRFLDDYRDGLKIEVYALQNKKLNEKHGEFRKDHPLYGGVVKAMEIMPTTMNMKKTDDDFQKMVNTKTEPYLHHSQHKPKNIEDLLAEKQEELKGQGLGDVVAIKVEEKKDDGGSEEG